MQRAQSASRRTTFSAQLLVLVMAGGCGVSEIERPAPGLPSGGEGGSGGSPSEVADAAPVVGAMMPVDAARSTDGPAPDATVASDAGATPDAPVEIELPPLPGGPAVPRQQIIAFVHIGHSNMAGRATEPSGERPYFYEVDPHLWSFHGTDMVTGRAPFVWRAAKEPLSPDPMTGTMAGPGMAILRAAQMHAPALNFVSTGHGQSGENGGTCANYRKGGLLYEVAMAPARQLRGHVTFGGIFTMLGTTERHLPESLEGFATCMQSIALAMREDLGDPNIPFMMSDFEMEATGDTAPTQPYAQVIIPQLRQAAAMIPRAALIPTEKLEMEGSHHFSMAGHHQWGLRGMQVMKDRGWAPWATQ